MMSNNTSPGSPVRFMFHFLTTRVGVRRPGDLLLAQRKDIPWDLP